MEQALSISRNSDDRSAPKGPATGAPVIRSTGSSHGAWVIRAGAPHPWPLAVGELDAGLWFCALDSKEPDQERGYSAALCCYAPTSAGEACVSATWAPP